MKASDGTPAANAAVTFTIKKSDHSTATGSATTGSNGTAVYKYRLKKQDPTGSYTASATATVNGAVTGQGAMSFTVAK